MKIFFLFLLTILGACYKKPSPSDQNQQVLRLNIHAEPPTLDARKATDTISIPIIQMCFEGLMRRVPGESPQPALAMHIESSIDLLTYTFHLRQSNWSDGTPVTAYDFESSWKSILHPHFPSGFANDLYILKNGRAAKNGRCPIDAVGVKAKGPLTLVVQLEYPTPCFLDLVASHSFLAVPSHIAEKESHWADHSGPLFVSNGPYRLKKWRHHNQLILIPNENYWDRAAIQLKEIQIQMVEDENTELQMFESGELDWAGNPLSTIPTDAIHALTQQGAINFYPLSGTYYYIFNTRIPPFNNLNLRRAFTYAINRREIIDHIAQAQQESALTLMPPTIWQPQAVPFQDCDLQKARYHFKLALKELGYTKETLPPITLIYNKSDAHHKIAQAIQEQWRQAFGICIHLQNVEWKVFLNELAHGQFQIARMGSLANSQDPLAYFDSFRYQDSHMNFSGWNHERFNDLLFQAERTLNPSKREKLLRQAEKFLIEECPVAPIYYYIGTYLKKHYVNGVTLGTFSDIDFKFAFVESP